ncbi:MAG: ribonuclease HII [candidate division Zixibacteria bacterium]|nr:ribonuclease HII [candidate division Zixibacteria bacterium]
MWKQGIKLIAGVDEAGRGPLAGPVVAAAVILPPRINLKGIKDSKKLSFQRREEFFQKISDLALSVGVGIVDEKRIDGVNILNASLEAMRSAILNLNVKPEFVLVDGNKEIPGVDIPQLAIIAGDESSLFVACASVIAKVTRDRLMLKYHQTYPQFHFDQNKGYGTKLHLDALKTYGPCEIHRFSFNPVKLCKEKQRPLKFKS